MKKYVQKAVSVASAVGVMSQLAVAGVMAAVGDNSSGTISTITPPGGFATDIGTLFNNILTFVFIIASLLVFFYLIWGGIDWITSGGDKGQTEKARNKITASIVGLIVLLASFAILQLVLRFFTGGSDLNAIINQNVNNRITQ